VIFAKPRPMKKFHFFLVLLFLNLGCFSQKGWDTDMALRKMGQLFNRAHYHEVIEYANEYLTEFPNDSVIVKRRMKVNLLLNDYYAARNDARIAKKLGLKGKEPLIEMLLSKSFLLNKGLKETGQKIHFDRRRNFKPYFTLKDSLAGGLRPERECFDVFYYDLTVKILPSKKKIEGSNVIHFSVLDSCKRIQIDLFENLEVHAINFNNKKLNFERLYNALLIDFDEILLPGQECKIEINYYGKPIKSENAPWQDGFVWGKKRSKDWIGVCCQAMGASLWWPCKDHPADRPDSVCINIQVPEPYLSIANGNLREVTQIEKGYRDFSWFVSYPINPYNLTFYMGMFENFNETYARESGDLQIDYYVLPHNLELAKKYYGQTTDIIKVFEGLYGEFPFSKDGAAMVESPFCGMEHQTALAIGDEYEERFLSDFSAYKESHVLVHALAHEWWGNAVAVNDKADSWISEGFATYSRYLFIEKSYGQKAYLDAIAQSQKLITSIWPLVGTKGVNDPIHLGLDIAEKGACVLHNLRCCINNDSLFFSILKDFYQTNKYKTVETKDFIAFVNQKTEKDYSAFFQKFLYSDEPPVLEYNYWLSKGELVFMYRWINVDEGFEMPFCINIDQHESIRLVGTTSKQVFKSTCVEHFYLPNSSYYFNELMAANSFTYFWTHWL
jgi:aminopeptidase N